MVHRSRTAGSLCVLGAAICLNAPAAHSQASFSAIGVQGSVHDISPDGKYISGRHRAFLLPSWGAYVWSADSGANYVGDGYPNGTVKTSGDGATLGYTIPGGDGLDYAATWTAADGWQALPGMPGGGCGASQHTAYDISCDGSVVVGLVWDGCSATGFRWTADTGIVQLATEGNASRVNGVSDDGNVMVGWDSAPEGTWIATMWNVDGTRTTVGISDPMDPGYGYSEAWAANRDGSVVVGSAYLEAFRWTAAGGYEGIGSLSPSHDIVAAQGVSDDGSVIVGFSGNYGSQEAFVWIEGIGMQALDDYLIANGATIDPTWELINAVVSADGLQVAGTAWPDGRVQQSQAFYATLPGSVSGGTLTQYGVGCAGTAGLVPDLSGSGTAMPCGNISVQIADGLPNGFGLLLMSLTQDSIPLGACTLNVGFPVLSMLPLVLDGNGEFEFGGLLAADLPGDVHLYLQFLASDSGGVDGKRSASPGLDIHFR